MQSIKVGGATAPPALKRDAAPTRHPERSEQSERSRRTTTNIVWFDGSLHDIDDVKAHPFTHALHYGSGVFEGIRAYETPRGTGIFRLSDHLDRLYKSADVYDIVVPYTKRELGDAIFQTLEANNFTAGYIRPLVYFGEGGIALSPKFNCPVHALVALKPLAGSLIGDVGAARVTVSPWQKTSSRAVPSWAKACGHYTNSILALHDAKTRGFDEAILLNDRGDVAEGTGENIFFVKDGILHTNDVTADTLPGITQSSVIALAQDAEIPLRVAPFTLDDLYAADEVFFTGTAAELMPIAAIDDHTFTTTRPITQRLAHDYTRAVLGENALHPHWVEYS
jgi:branched-chain amino acid aminotransferase